MKTKDENKKGFWASLFAPKPCTCSSCHGEIVEIKILGPGCAKCKETYTAIDRIVQAHHLDVKVTKIDDIVEIMSYNIMSTPAILVDGVLKIKGRVPSENEIKQLLGII